MELRSRKSYRKSIRNQKAGLHFFPYLFRGRTKNTKLRNRKAGLHLSQFACMDQNKVWSSLMNNNGERVTKFLRKLRPYVRKKKFKSMGMDEKYWREIFGKLQNEFRTEMEIKSLCLHLWEMYKTFSYLTGLDNFSYDPVSLRVTASDEAWRSVYQESPQALFFKENPCKIFLLLEKAFSPVHTTNDSTSTSTSYVDETKFSGSISKLKRKVEDDNANDIDKQSKSSRLSEALREVQSLATSISLADKNPDKIPGWCRVLNDMNISPAQYLKALRVLRDDLSSAIAFGHMRQAVAEYWVQNLED